MPPLSARVKDQTILVIDDTPENLTLMRNLLSGSFFVKIAPSGERGLDIAKNNDLDLILLDIVMPDMDGYQVCQHLKNDPATKDIPVIFLTAKNSLDDEQYGLDLGAVDFISKPFNPTIFLSRIRSQLLLRKAQILLQDQNKRLEVEVKNRTKDLTELQDATILSMASMAETRDNETGNHILRTQEYVKMLSKYLQTHPLFKNFLTDENIEILFKSAPLHDIGKIGIPDSILLKPGRLTDEEMTIMKTHTTIGKQIIESTERRLGRSIPFLQIAKEIAFSHQEKWNGSGYPMGLNGNQIPISARLMAVADVYDALISRRVYKPAMTHEQAVEIMLEGRGSHFDPDILDAFLQVQSEFAACAGRFVDKDHVTES
ncbi:HD domain-containing phosphohydrolase [Undibacterium sp. SXout11W]|uniref:HD domain-containing phosphohydrolase n=1 Tax=Undibacterium sp. SXout11W TaxID=3413050 RepID=UPI003BF19689